MVYLSEVLEVMNKGVGELVVNATKAQWKTQLEDKRKDYKAFYFIHQSIDGVIFEKITSASTSKKACDMLEEL